MIHSSGAEVRSAAKGAGAEVRSAVEGAGADTRRAAEGTGADTRGCPAVKLRTLLGICFNYL